MRQNNGLKIRFSVWRLRGTLPRRAASTWTDGIAGYAQPERTTSVAADKGFADHRVVDLLRNGCKHLCDLVRVKSGLTYWVKLRERFISITRWPCSQRGWIRVLDAPMHDDMGRFVAQIFKSKQKPSSVVLAPRGHGKSKEISSGLRQLGFCCNPEHEGADPSRLRGTGGRHHAGEIQQRFESNKLLRAMFPDVCWAKPRSDSPLWTKNEIVVKRKVIDHTPSIAASSDEFREDGSALRSDHR
jgi:hypothetical protein